MPGPPYRSALEPFLDFITEERRKGKTWKAIAEGIAANNGPLVTPQGVQDFFKRRRKKKPRVLMGMEPVQPPQSTRESQPPVTEPAEDIYDEAHAAYLNKKKDKTNALQLNQNPAPYYERQTKPAQNTDFNAIHWTQRRFNP